jgi:SMI1 / KNR4 family (SUKH-1)
MTSASYKDLFAKFRANLPASPESIARCATAGFSPPADYVRFLLQLDGREGFIGEHYVMLWSIERFIEMNTQTYFAEAAPGLVVFGSDGGGEAFAFDTRDAPPPIVVAPHVGMEWDATIRMAPDFDSFLQHLYRSKDFF